MSRLIRTLWVVPLLVAGMAAVAAPAHAEMTCPTPIQVSIDIKPGSYPNSIKLSSKGTVPVALLSTAAFDASQFAPEMAHLSDASAGMTCAGAQAVSWTKKDVNGDGLPDLLFKFNTADLNLTPSSTSATFMAHGIYQGAEVHVMGSDSVRVLP